MYAVSVNLKTITARSAPSSAFFKPLVGNMFWQVGHSHSPRFIRNVWYKLT